MEVHFHLKMLPQAELETEGSRLATIFGSPPTPHQTHMVALPQTHFLGGKFHFRRIPRDYRENYRNSSEKAGIPANSFSTREGRSAVKREGQFGVRSFQSLGNLVNQ